MQSAGIPSAGFVLSLWPRILCRQYICRSAIGTLISNHLHGEKIGLDSCFMIRRGRDTATVSYRKVAMIMNS